MFKRNNYSKRALSTFEIVASFIVDLYYNHFYQEAKKIRIEGRVESVTDGYKHAVKAYLSSFQNPDSYRKTIVGIHKYYYTTTRFSTISFSECVDEIVSHFIPDDFFESTTNQQRDGILRMVLMTSVKRFSSDVLCSNILDSIIDNHSDTATVRDMQNKMVESLMFEREKMFQKIFNGSNKPDDGNNFTVIMKMKTEMVKLVKEHHKMISKYDNLKRKAVEMLGVIKEQRERIEMHERSTRAPEREYIKRPDNSFGTYEENGFDRAPIDNTYPLQTRDYLSAPIIMEPSPITDIASEYQINISDVGPVDDLYNGDVSIIATQEQPYEGSEWGDTAYESHTETNAHGGEVQSDHNSYVDNANSVELYSSPDVDKGVDIVRPSADAFFGGNMLHIE